MVRSLPLLACCLALITPLAALAAALPSPVVQTGDGEVLHGRTADGAAKVDTLFLLGGPGALDGKFQTATGAPAWHGWTSVDLTTPDDDELWTVTDDEALVIAGSRSLWCGTTYPPDAPSPGPGYGNGWDHAVVFTMTVPSNLLPGNVEWSLKLRYDTEPGYDFVHLEWNRGGEWVALASFDHDSADAAIPPDTHLELTYSFPVAAEDYVGPGGDWIQLRIRFVSDGAWSDEDGLWPTERGACQVDDISVVLDGGLVEFEDFESGTPGAWVPVSAPGVGDFAQVWPRLEDLDPCRTNWSPQVGFIDDGLVVPGTGGTPGQTWTYGPGGYILNHSGGLAGEGHHLHNAIVSPVLAWPGGGHVGAILAFDGYFHEPLSPLSPGMFWTWHVRSVDTGDPADLAAAAWEDYSFVYLDAGPYYRRVSFDITGLLAAGRTHLQVRADVVQLGWLWGWDGPDGTPAPYFDNFAVAVFPHPGPAITTRVIDIFQDGFPASGGLDPGDLASNAIRLDMARNISPTAHGLNTPGDTIIADIRTVRAGYTLHGPPRLLFALRANPLFDAVRDLGDPLLRDVQVSGGVVTGHVEGLPTYDAAGNLLGDRWNFDLPDSGFFYPGDVLHYYLEAQDILGDDPATIGTTRLPADLDHFGDFDRVLGYSSAFTVRGLPGLFSTTPGDQPRILWWNDAGTAGVEQAWLSALANLGFLPGADLDLYATNGPSSNRGNGLGGRATAAQLAGYRVLLYTAGSLSSHVLGSGTAQTDLGDDIGLLAAWLGAGSPTEPRSALLAGDRLATSLLGSTEAQAFRDEFVGVSTVPGNVLVAIGNQTAPLVRSVAGNGVIGDDRTWIAYGGCPGLRWFDSVLVAGAAERLAYFTAPDGEQDPYPFAAAVRHVHAASGARVVLLPYDLAAIQSPGAAGKTIPARALVLQDILASFDELGGSPPTGVVPDLVLTVGNHPNPFNPATTIRLTLPRAGRTSLKIYNVRGELVRTLVDGRFEAGIHDLVWDGKDDGGRPAASGVYFPAVAAQGTAKVGKMVLVR